MLLYHLSKPQQAHVFNPYADPSFAAILNSLFHSNVHSSAFLLWLSLAGLKVQHPIADSFYWRLQLGFVSRSILLCAAAHRLGFKDWLFVEKARIWHPCEH